MEKMRHAYNSKWKKRNNEKERTPSITGSGHHQIIEDERKLGKCT